jgi:class 3 adenylate cyclase/tetratricopeptide (TPR) repeat protein
VDVAAWLRELGLEEYAQLFRDNDIDGEILCGMTAADLKELGINSFGHRRRLFNAIGALRTVPPTRDAAQLATSATSAPTSTPPIDAERRQLTVMFCDLVGSTPLSARLDPEDLRRIIGAYHRCVAEIVESFGGFVARYMGDGVLVYFGYPQAHEDDAERATRCGLALVDRVPQLNEAEEIHARVGIATGLVVVGGEVVEHDVAGDTPYFAARLQARAEPDTVVIAASTRRLVGDLFEYRDLGQVELKGITEPVSAWRALRPSAVESRFEALRGSALTPLVGRDEEIDLLLRRWARAKSGDGQVVLLSGEPGIGKSRLTAALHEQLNVEPHTRVRYFCSPHRGDSALYPVIAQLERAAGFEHDDLPAAKLGKVDTLLRQSGEASDETLALMADLLSLPCEGRFPALPSDPQRKREMTLTALLKQLEGLAARRPVLMIFEDAYWADSTSLELLDRTIERADRLPVLVVVTFRPEFRAPWVGQAGVTPLALNRLARHHAATLIDGVTGGKALPLEILDRIVERTDGIPLFIEELTKNLLEGGLLHQEASRYVLAGPLPPLAIPASLQASLMARLDRLPPVAREVSQIGAAIGREFSYDLLAAVAQRGNIDLIDALDQLVEAGLIFRTGTPPRVSFVFKHALVQDAAYNILLRGRRQELHGRIGNALKDRFAEVAETHPEVVAHHLSEAGILESAIDYWRKAAERSLRRSAGIEALRHLLRGIQLMQTLAPSLERNRQALEQYLALGRMTRIVKGMGASDTLHAFSKAHDLLDKDATVDQQMIVLYGLWGAHYSRAEYAAARGVALECLNLEKRDTRDEAPMLANYMMGVTLCTTGEFIEARHYLEQSIELCTLTDAASAVRARRNLDVTALSYLAWTLWALGYAEQAADAVRQAAARARNSGHVPLIAFVSSRQVFLATALSATHAPIAASADQVIAYCIEHGVKNYELSARFCLGITVARHGEPRQGLEIMRAAMEAMVQDGAYKPLYLGQLAAAHRSLSEIEIGLSLVGEAIRIADGTGERMFEAELHRLRGDLLLDRGSTEDAEGALDTAIAIARRQQARLWELRAATSLARFKRRLGRGEEARQAIAPIYDWFTEGFDTPDLKEAKVLIDNLASAGS